MFIIDFDDTLFDTQQFKVNMHSALVSCGVTNEDAEWSYTAARNLPDGQFAYSHARRAEFLATRGYDGQKIVTELERVTAPEALQNLLLPGASEFLETVKTLGEPLILLSVGDPNFQELKVRGSGIAHYFDRLFLVPDSKEKIISELLDHHKPTECWFINDKVEETVLIIKKFPHIRPLFKKPNNSKVDFKNTGILSFSDLVEMGGYIIGAKPRHESIGALVFKNSEQKEILVMSRAEKNTLHLPKGTREKDETPEMTLTRELKEEANVECLIKNYLISVPSVFIKNNQVYEKITHYYIAEYIRGDLKSNDQEHDKVFWLSVVDAKVAFLEKGAHLQLGFENEVKVIEAVL